MSAELCTRTEKSIGNRGRPAAVLLVFISFVLGRLYLQLYLHRENAPLTSQSLDDAKKAAVINATDVQRFRTQCWQKTF